MRTRFLGCALGAVLIWAWAIRERLPKPDSSRRILVHKGSQRLKPGDAASRLQKEAPAESQDPEIAGQVRELLQSLSDIASRIERGDVRFMDARIRLKLPDSAMWRLR